MDDLDRKIINELQKNFPVCDHPFAVVAAKLETTEAELILRLQHMLDEKLLTRFGPIYNAERLGGAVSLCALAVQEDDFDFISEKVNTFPQVAHNYQREHELNMWFVLATETKNELDETIKKIEADTGLPVRNMPKLQEFYVGLHFEI